MRSVRIPLLALAAGASVALAASAASADALDDALSALTRARVTDENRISAARWRPAASGYGRDLVVSGVAQKGARRVTVKLGDGALRADAVPEADGAWSITFRAGDLASLPAGDVVASATVWTAAGAVPVEPVTAPPGPGVSAAAQDD